MLFYKKGMNLDEFLKKHEKGVFSYYFDITGIHMGSNRIERVRFLCESYDEALAACNHYAYNSDSAREWWEIQEVKFVGID